MPSQDEAGEYYQSLKPNQFTYLERFVVYQDDEPLEDTKSQFSLEIRLIGNTGTLHMSFRGVSDLQMDLSKGYGQFFVRINPIHDYQWEGLKYHVTEENHQLSFYCQSFEVKLEEGQNNG